MKYVLMILGLMLSGILFAQSGFGTSTASATSVATNGGTVARAEHDDALWVNPAGLVRRDRTLSLSLPFTSQKSSYGSPGDALWKSDGEDEMLPFVTFQDKWGNFAFGLGSAVTHHYGHEFDDPDFPGRFLSTGMSFDVREHSVGAAYQFGNFSVGASFRQLDANLTWSRTFVDVYDSGFGAETFEIQETYEGDDQANGISIGLQYYRSKRFNLGFNYQSEIDLRFEGDHQLTQSTALNQTEAQDVFSLYSNGPFVSDFVLPAKWSAGVTTKITVRTRVEFDVAWQEWSAVDQQVFQSGTQLTVDRQWHDSVTIKATGDFQQKKAILWHLGIANARSVSDKNLMDPSFPDSDRFHYSFGFSFSRGKWMLDGGYQYIQYRDRLIADQEYGVSPSVPGYIFNLKQTGIYETQRHLLALGLRYTF